MTRRRSLDKPAARPRPVLSKKTGSSLDKTGAIARGLIQGKKTKQQRQYDREQRALLRLRRAAVAWSECEDHEDDRLVDLQAASDAYTTSLSPRDRKRLLK